MGVNVVNKWQAIQSFWSGFGIPAYDETSVPDDAVYPYITYNAAVGEFEQMTQLTASVWYRSSSWEGISNKVDEISESIYPYKLLKVDDGYVYIYKGNPFAQRMADENYTLRRVYLILYAEFLSKY